MYSLSSEKLFLGTSALMGASVSSTVIAENWVNLRKYSKNRVQLDDVEQQCMASEWFNNSVVECEYR